MTFLLGVMLIILPLCIGSGLKIVMGKGQSSLCLVYVSGSLGMFCLSGVCQFITILGKFPFSWYSKILWISALILSLVGAVAGILSKNKVIIKWDEIRKKAAPIVVFFVMGLFLILYTRTDNTGDFTLETVATTLETDSIYEYNSFTGMQIEEGMPIRQKILTPPFLYAAISNVFSVPAQRVVHLYVPMWLLLNVICIIWLWSKELFDTTDKQKLFLWFAVVLSLFSGYGMSAWGYQMWNRGYTGNAWVVSVVVPLVIYACTRRKIMLGLIAVGTEIFLAWTTYGIGFGLVAAFICCVTIFVQWMVGRLRKDKTCI